jgi:hypothetical protein
MIGPCMSSRPTAAADMNETTVSPALRLLRAAGNGNRPPQRAHRPLRAHQ